MKRFRLAPTSVPNRPWIGQSSNLIVNAVEDFEVEFEDVNGDIIQAQVMIVKVRKKGSGDRFAMIGRSLEVVRQSQRMPRKGSVSDVTPVPDYPWAYTLTYTKNGTEEQVPVEIITHSTTPGHNK